MIEGDNTWTGHIIVGALALIGVIEALVIALWGMMSKRVERIEDSIQRVDDSVTSCFEKNDETFVPRKEYEASIKYITTGVQTLVNRNKNQRGGDSG